jgi:hypothetical protein
VWQNAQLTAMRSAPRTAFFEKPIGNSRPGSQITPSDAYPPGPGSLSANIRGSTCQIQYGSPSSASMPTEPYLKCSTAEDASRAGWATAPTHAPTSATTTAMAAPRRCIRFDTRRRASTPWSDVSGFNG